MTLKQRAAIGAAPAVLLTMAPVFQLTGNWLGREAGWYAGFPVYWIVWCIVFPLSTVGWSGIRETLRSRHMSTTDWSLVTLPPMMALFARLGLGVRPHLVLPWLGMSLLNGVLEEVFWRGMYTLLFPNSVRWAVLWPTLWFAVWHFAPGRLSMGDRVMVLVVGAAVFGVCMAWVARRTRSIRWTIVSHVMAGVVQA